MVQKVDSLSGLSRNYMDFLGGKTKMHSGKKIFNFLFLFVFICFFSGSVEAGLFGLKTSPGKNESESLGYYWSGALKNASVLQNEGKGYQVVRTSRKRYYGHNDLVDFIQELGEEMARKERGIILVGDMAKKEGGRIPGIHQSHQNGLDADIFYSLQKNYLSASLRERRGPQSVLSSRGIVDPNKWTPSHSTLLKMASEDDRVERIFVNFAIKKHLCKIHGNQEWLSKIRPMAGHTGHFHVRLTCPENSLSCIPQPKPAQGSGC